MEGCDEISITDSDSIAPCTETATNILRHIPSAARTAPAQGQGSLQHTPSTMSLQDLRQLIQALKAPAPPLADFNGLSHEDPRAFIKDEIEGQPSKTKEESTRKQISSNHVQEVRLPECHYCPARHFHRECTILEQRRTNPTENERRTSSQN